MVLTRAQHVHEEQKQLRLQPSLLKTLGTRELGTRGFRSLERETAIHYSTAPALLFTEPCVFTRACYGVDKAFCAAWLDHRHVLVGTKCHTLLHLDTASGSARRIPLPPEPRLREGPDLLRRPPGSGSHGGLRCLAISPDGQLLATGGRGAQDAVVLSLADGMRPRGTYMGHADWVFGVTWVTDRHFATCSRDSTIKLWRAADDTGSDGSELGADGSSDAGPSDGSGGAGGGDMVAPLASVVAHTAKARDIRYEATSRRLVSLGQEGCIKTWDPSSLQPIQQLHLGTSQPDLVALAVQDDLAVAGGRDSVLLWDLRSGKGIGEIPSGTPTGVRSLQLRGPILSFGTGINRYIAFHDLRVSTHAGPRPRAPRRPPGQPEQPLSPMPNPLLAQQAVRAWGRLPARFTVLAGRRCRAEPCLLEQHWMHDQALAGAQLASGQPQGLLAPGGGWDEGGARDGDGSGGSSGDSSSGDGSEDGDDSGSDDAGSMQGAGSMQLEQQQPQPWLVFPHRRAVHSGQLDRVAAPVAAQRVGPLPSARTRVLAALQMLRPQLAAPPTPAPRPELLPARHYPERHSELPPLGAAGTAALEFSSYLSSVEEVVNPTACYAHAWDASGTKLFAAGGPLAAGASGCYMVLWE